MPDFFLFVFFNCMKNSFRSNILIFQHISGIVQKHMQFGNIKKFALNTHAWYLPILNINLSCVLPSITASLSPSLSRRIKENKQIISRARTSRHTPGERNIRISIVNENLLPLHILLGDCHLNGIRRHRPCVRRANQN